MQQKDLCRHSGIFHVWEILILFCFNLRYFQAANPSAIERNIYSVPIPASISVLETPAELNALTDPSEPNFYTASFSPEAGFYMLSYQGPNIPWQRIVQTNDASKVV